MYLELNITNLHLRTPSDPQLDEGKVPPKKTLWRRKNWKKPLEVSKQKKTYIIYN